MMTFILKILTEIKETRSFEKLESFKDPQAWEKMTLEERSLFALALTMQGAQQISRGDHQVLESFELASLVAPSSSLFYEQGLVFVAYSDNIRCLEWARQAFDRAIQCDPQSFSNWHESAKALVKLGLFDGDSHCFVEALNNFEKASRLMDLSVVSAEEFYWQWGACWAALGKSSGEPHDFYRAVHKFQLASDLGYEEESFLNDYGQSLVELGNLLEKPELFVEALRFFDQAINQAPTCFEGHYNQACCLHRLCELTELEDCLNQAQKSFSLAADINPACGPLWLKWGQLEAMIGKLKHDDNYIESSLIKMEKADRLDPNQSATLSCWGEIELYLGSQQERLDLIQSAKIKVIKSLEIQPENPDGWYLYGSCLSELGRYFEDEKFYCQAIEKFEYGTTLSDRNPLLWYGLALTYFALGELNDDFVLFEKASHYCARVIECGGGAMAQFWNDWGVALLKLGEVTGQPSYIELAIEKFERALKQPLVELEYEEFDLEWIYNYGCACDLIGDLTDNPKYYEKAIQILSQVVQLDPDYVHARYNLALSFSHLGEATCEVDHYYKALEHFYVLVEEDPEDEMAQMDLGISLVNLALLIQEDHHPERAQVLYREAESHLMQSVALGNGQAYYQLAGLYALTDLYASAMLYMERALSLGALPAVDELLHDDWLEGLRETPAFKHFITQLSSQQSKED